MITISEVMRLKLLDQITSGRDAKGVYIEYDRIVIAFTPIPGQQSVEFFSGLDLIGGVEVTGLDRSNTLTLSEIEGRMRIKVIA